jgi:hypothetical protein
MCHYISRVIKNIKNIYKDDIQQKIYEILNIIDQQKIFVKGFITDENPTEQQI